MQPREKKEHVRTKHCGCVWCVHVCMCLCVYSCSQRFTYTDMNDIMDMNATAVFGF